MAWVRLWDDMPTDPKWRVIAKRSGRTIAEAMAVFNFMLVAASKANGNLDAWSDEDVAAALDMEPEHVEAIRNAMQGKVLTGDRLSAWEVRQPKREDDSSQRVRAHRERERDAVKRTVTQCNAGETQRNAPDTDTDTDSVANATGAAAPPPTDRDWLWSQGLDLLAKHSGKPGSSLRSVIGRWLRDTGDNAAQLRAEIEAATGPPNPVAEPIAWITARLKPKAPHGQSEQFRRRTAQFAGLAAAAESLAAGEDVGSGVAALPKPGTPGRGVEIAESGLPEGAVRLSAAGGRAGH